MKRSRAQEVSKEGGGEASSDDPSPPFRNTNNNHNNNEGSSNYSSTSSGGTTSSLTLPSNKRPQNPTTLLTQGELQLAKELEALSFHDRTHVYEEIHGVDDIIQETPLMIQQGLQDVQRVIDQTRKKVAYDKAAFLSPSYVQDRALMLLALRACRWDAFAAAKKILDLYQKKYELFPLDCLARDIVWQDLPQDAQSALKTGAHYQWPKDNSGRMIVLDNWVHWKFASVQSHAQAIWYSIFSTPIDEATQRKGRVAIIYAVHAPRSTFAEALEICKMNFFPCLPYRLNSMHMCLSGPQLRPLFGQFLASLPKEARLRFKWHYGSPQQVLEALHSFGIAPDVLPIHLDGTVKQDVIDQRLEYFWERERIAKEERLAIEAQGKVYLPTKVDVLLGRGLPYQRYSGNILLNEICHQRKKEYQSTRSKTALVDQVMHTIHETHGGRFLQRPPAAADPQNNAVDYWVIADRKLVYEKISMTFRNSLRNKDTNNNTNNPVKSSSTSSKTSIKSSKKVVQPPPPPKTVVEDDDEEEDAYDRIFEDDDEDDDNSNVIQAAV